MDSVSPHLPRIPRLQSLTLRQRGQFAAYAEMLGAMNRKVNLVSREAEEDIARIHVPHVLALAVRAFPQDAVIVDWGTGGGLPAIPLAILYPGLSVHAVDAVEKKIFAVRAMARRLELENLEAWAGDASQWPGSATHSVSRATAPLVELWHWHSRSASPLHVADGNWPAGLLCLKGGDLTDEIAELHAASSGGAGPLVVETIPLRDLYASSYFATKYVVHVYENARA